MMTKQKQLFSRGYVEDEIESKYLNFSFYEIIDLLQSKNPTDRTIGARLLSKRKEKEKINLLIKALTIEKKLYSKLEICNSLVNCGEISIKPLIEMLGKIGINQHKEIPQKEFKKDSYPLPRDIVSRTLIRFEETALSYLEEILNIENMEQLSEGIDTIGFICFYKYNSFFYKELENCYYKNN